MNLQNKRILITRPRHQAESFADALRAAGAEPVYFPVIEIAPATDLTALDHVLQNLTAYTWLVMTSVNGVQFVWQRLSVLGISQLPTGLKVAAIGPKTAAELRLNGVTPDFVPEEYIAEAILPGLGDIHNQKILLARADIARPALAQAIQAAGGIPHEIAAYQTLPAEPDPDGLAALQDGIDILTFTSSSTVRNFVALLRSVGLDPLNLHGQPLVACIGPITAATAQEEGFTTAVVAETYTTEGLIQAMQNL